MPIVDGGKDYVAWADVEQLVRWLEDGYGGRLKFVMTYACPKGEQFYRQYWEVLWCDHALEERPTSQRILGRFPSLRGQSLPAALLGVLYQADSILAQTYLWAEPKVAAKPRRDPQEH
jgi:hypothetical protein